ncbi:fructose-bisphosphate aldolase [Marssonina coronariae]|uniref:Fructose-bisphosphate aldolase n=1 Tax=Diplocarpon coronariae TaxID=2795749 RepID=A0A218Z9P8_9HELO|nr:fructose-bisphosphate aldolase [Marssonina coronariae]
MAAPKSLADNKSSAILDAAEKGGYGVIAVCCYNFEEIVATCRAAEATSSPAMVLLFPWAMQRFGPLLVNMAADACRSARVPVALHLDHCQDAELVRYAATLPFDSIMVDMSHHDKEENLRLTRELTAHCHERGIATEAEPGRIEGGEDGVRDTAALEGILTTPAQAREFLDTGIDYLAPAFGNVHGAYSRHGPRAHLQFAQLEAVQQAARERGRLVLHGSGSFTEDLYQDCIKRGISKINVNAQLVEPWSEMMRARTEFTPLTKLVEDSIDLFQAEVEKLMRMAGSCGRA